MPSPGPQGRYSRRSLIAACCVYIALYGAILYEALQDNNWAGLAFASILLLLAIVGLVAGLANRN